MEHGYDDDSWKGIEAHARSQIALGLATFVGVTDNEITITFATTNDEGLRRWFRLRIDRNGGYDIID